MGEYHELWRNFYGENEALGWMACKARTLVLGSKIHWFIIFTVSNIAFFFKNPSIFIHFQTIHIIICHMLVIYPKHPWIYPPGRSKSRSWTWGVLDGASLLNGAPEPQEFHDVFPVIFLGKSVGNHGCYPFRSLLCISCRWLLSANSSQYPRAPGQGTTPDAS